MKHLITAALLAALPALAHAGTQQIDLDALPGKTVHDTATLKPLALTEDGKPLSVLLEVPANAVVPAHATKSGLRMLTVVDGTLYWGDGDKIDAGAETVYPQGSILMVRPGEMHWLAAREGALRLQLVVMPDDAPTPGVAKQLN
ncbi:cupin domain-containing protein [Shimia marina]|uniref:Cupin domain protein n=1 Tax=Shimia marina TaxID=321267 RepID=A0A0P1EKC2_9RHOB|nr:hypothetical protein [Shimia marina]CUH50903.1 hypothetical protein SHM7688_00334 [Shimia marina]SFE56419.1 Cupin domain protein [Shimia marina]